MQNYKAPGDVLDALAPYDVVAGEGAKVGSIFGVACDDALSGAAVRLKTEGIFEMEKTSAQAWAVGERIYWDDSTKKCDNVATVGMLIGYCTEIAANPTAVGKVKLFGIAPDLSEGAQAALVDLTDSTGLSGSHDDTLAATAALVDLTDSTGQSGTHDDTLAATTVPAALTGGESPTEAEHNSVLTLLGVMVQNQSDVAQKVKELVAQIAVTNQNVSDTAQKVKEIRAILVGAGLAT